MKPKKLNILIFLVLICLISSFLFSCAKSVTGKYIPEDQYDPNIVIDSMEFNGDTVHIEAGGESYVLSYKIADNEFQIDSTSSIIVNDEELPLIFTYNKTGNSSFELNNIKYVLEDSLKNQDRGMNDDNLSVEDEINEYIETDEFQKFIDNYSEGVEAVGRVRVDAYASGSTLVVEHKYIKTIPDNSYQKIRKHYKKYLDNLYKDKKKRKKFIKIKKDSAISGMKLKLIVVDKDGNFIAEKNI